MSARGRAESLGDVVRDEPSKLRDHALTRGWSDTVRLADFSVGTEVPVLIYAITPDRFYASIKRATPDPWADPSRFALGTRHPGKVRAVLDWGCTIELPCGVLAVFLTPGHRMEFAIGHRLEVEVVLVDPRLRKLIVKPI